MKARFPNAPEISFAKWFLFTFPFAIGFLLLCWGLFCLMFIRRPQEIHLDSAIFRREYAHLGPMKFSEKVILGALLTMCFLWLTRVGFSESVPGWGLLFSDLPGDGTVALFVVSFFFILPASLENHEQKILDWEDTKGLPWGILLLLGSGFSMANAFVVSGLSSEIAKNLKTFENLHVILLLYCISFIVTLITEFSSNVATANITLPILAAMAASIGENPFLFMIVATLSSSLGFMLPVSTPPNVITLKKPNFHSHLFFIFSFFFSFLKKRRLYFLLEG